MPDDIDELSPKAFLTRPQLVRFLNKHGFPITFSTITKLCAPARRGAARCRHLGKAHALRSRAGARVGTQSHALGRA